VAIVAGAAVAGGMLAGDGLVTLGGDAGVDLLTNRVINQGIGDGQRELLKQPFKTRTLPEGLSRRTLELYRVLAKRAINAEIDASGVQAERLKLIEEALRLLR
jgi:hypothetical protein